MKKQGIFITATDTGVGKTVVTGLLAHYLIKKGYQTVTQKWIQTGTANALGDLKTHCDFMGKNYGDHKLCVPYSFALPASPHLAAHTEKRNIDPRKIKNSYEFLADLFDFIVVEGTGGILVPYNEKGLVIDIAQDLNLPVLIVAPNKLGVINHLFLTIEALRARNAKIIGIIFIESRGEKKIIRKNNPKIVAKLGKVKILGELPWKKNKKELRKAFVKIGAEIVKELS